MSSSDDSCGSQYPMAEIEYPGVHDVLCGRGGHAISHSGNVNFRMMVEQFKTKYVSATRYEKAKVIAEVVRLWRSQSPPGRFLTVSDPSLGDASKWHDVGDSAASKKVAQCLRERNPRAEYTTSQPLSSSAAAAAAAADPVTSSAPVPVAATSSAAVAPSSFPGAPPQSVEWKRKKTSQKMKAKQRKQAENSQAGKRQDSKGSVVHHQQHPKHQGQRQRQQQNAHNRQQNALHKQVQKQVKIAEQEVWQAQQQVNHQAQELQMAFAQRAQQDLVQRVQQEAAAAATQVVLNQLALQQVEQEIMKEQNLVNQKLNQQPQPQQQLPQPQPPPEPQLPVQPQFPQTQQQYQPQQLQELESPRLSKEELDKQEASHRAQDASSELSSFDSPLMWENSQAGSGSEMGSPSRNRRDSMAMGRAMPSAARLTHGVFDDDTNNGSSDSSSTTSANGADKMTKMIYSKLESFSDTTSDNGGNGSDTGAISDGSNSIARPEAYPPD